MSVDLEDASVRARASTQQWQDPAQYWSNLSIATQNLSAPVVAVQLDALSHNAHDLLRRAGGTPIRVASKSVRVRGILHAVLSMPGYSGVLAYSLAEAIWLAETIDDVLVAYPSVDRKSLMRLATDERTAQRVTIMIDSTQQLEFIDAVVSPAARSALRVCLDFDASWHAPVIGNVGVLRSPVHEPAQLRALAEEVARRPGFNLVGVMSYEAQIAGVGDAPKSQPLMGRVMRQIQRRSRAELVERRAEAIALVSSVAQLEFVNGGGTGSIERTVSEPVITEVAAGSGLFGPHLFDHYRDFTPAPAVAFALDVVRKPSSETATLLGGGWIASGAAGQDRLPQLVWPQGLRYSSREGAGEVQTPVLGDSAATLGVGDRVWLRHTKSGEIMEHTNNIIAVSGTEVQAELLTYRGEGRCFL